MNIEVNWDNAENTILRWTFCENWNWDQYDEAQDLSNSMIAQVEHVVHLVWDIRQSSNLPEGFIFGYKRTIRHQSSQLGYIVLVGANIFVTEMVGHLTSVLDEEGQRFHFSKTLDEAHHFIETEYLEGIL